LTTYPFQLTSVSAEYTCAQPVKVSSYKLETRSSMPAIDSVSSSLFSMYQLRNPPVFFTS